MKPRIERACKHCGKIMLLLPCHAQGEKNKTACSKACADAALKFSPSQVADRFKARLVREGECLVYGERDSLRRLQDTQRGYVSVPEMREPVCASSPSF